MATIAMTFPGRQARRRTTGIHGGARVDDSGVRSRWRDREWIARRDGKARRAKAGTTLMHDVLEARVPTNLDLGNSVDGRLGAEAIAEFIEGIGTRFDVSPPSSHAASPNGFR